MGNSESQEGREVERKEKLCYSKNDLENIMKIYQYLKIDL